MLVSVGPMKYQRRNRVVIVIKSRDILEFFSQKMILHSPLLGRFALDGEGKEQMSHGFVCST